MKIIAQDGKEYITYSVEHNDNKIKCINPTDRRKKVFLGEYKDLKRASEVFKEIQVSSGKGYYEMPEK